MDPESCADDLFDKVDFRADQKWLARFVDGDPCPVALNYQVVCIGCAREAEAVGKARAAAANHLDAQHRAGRLAGRDLVDPPRRRGAETDLRGDGCRISH